MIYTTYFAKLKKLPKNITPISICGWPPAGYSGPEYRTLAPKYDFFKQWKETGDNNFYIKCYNEQVLSKLNPDRVVADLYFQINKAPNSCDIALVCYEKSEDFCHRHLVARWLNTHGFECREYDK